ncbi:hypothetical protein [Streptosporangium sp. NPDC049644]|uniref:hypothetical protein n=1 Tax=Streptosporangium sp. NPDC049644 TaxID=3155507 RepID=UPI003414CACE
MSEKSWQLLRSWLAYFLAAAIPISVLVEDSQPCVSPPKGTWPQTAASSETDIYLPLTAAGMPRISVRSHGETVFSATYQTAHENKVEVLSYSPIVKNGDPAAALEEVLQESATESHWSRGRGRQFVDTCPGGIVVVRTAPLGGAAACYPSTLFKDPNTYEREPGAVCLFADRWSGATLNGHGMTVDELIEVMSRLRPAIQLPFSQNTPAPSDTIGTPRAQSGA